VTIKDGMRLAFTAHGKRTAIDGSLGGCACGVSAYGSCLF